MICTLDYNGCHRHIWNTHNMDCLQGSQYHMCTKIEILAKGNLFKFKNDFLKRFFLPEFQQTAFVPQGSDEQGVVESELFDV